LAENDSTIRSMGKRFTKGGFIDAAAREPLTTEVRDKSFNLMNLMCH
jgi:hypothetical protein